jgi:VIT1/CCC1 family predicted Fe2+/Mn2+ transporter
MILCRLIFLYEAVMHVTPTSVPLTLSIDVQTLWIFFALQASVTSALAFGMGAAIPLLAGAFLANYRMRILSVVLASVSGLILFGAVGASLGGSRPWVGALRVLIGGASAMAITYGIGLAFGVTVA